MLNVHVGLAGGRREEVGRQARARRAQLEQVVGERAHRRRCSGSRPRCSSGTSAGQTFGGNHTASTAASPVGVSAPTANDSLRSGGVSVPSTSAFASTPGGQPAAPADADRVALLDLVGQGEEPPRRRPHRGPQAGVDTVPGDQQEPGPLQRGVDLRGDRAAVGRRRARCRGRSVGIAFGIGPSGASPMSSCHSSGRAAMKSSISATQRGVVEQGDLDPVLGQPVVPAGERARLADHHARRCRTAAPARCSTSTATASSPWSFLR